MTSHKDNYLRFCNGESIDFIINGKHTKRTLEDIYNYNEEQLEDDHSFIQWIFPTPRASAYNHNAPILSIEDIKSLRTNENIINILLRFKEKMFSYWGIEPFNNSKISLLNSHNGLRLSRAIECLTLFGIDVKKIFDILFHCMRDGILKSTLEPFCENNRIEIPIWINRYYESVNK